LGKLFKEGTSEQQATKGLSSTGFSSLAFTGQGFQQLRVVAPVDSGAYKIEGDQRAYGKADILEMPDSIYAWPASAGEARSGKMRESQEDLPHAVLVAAAHTGGAPADIALAPLGPQSGDGNGSTASVSASGQTTPMAEGQQDAVAGAIDTDSLARDVYKILKWRLALEKERCALGG
jgi:hypothetical protein